MSRILAISTLVALLVCEPSWLRCQDSDKSKPTLSPAESRTPLSKDEIAIYRDVLDRHMATDRKSTNISRTTFPLDAAFLSNYASPDSDCLDGIHFDVSATETYHRLGPEVLPRKNMRLVDALKQGEIINHNDPSRTIKGGKPVGTAVSDAFATGMVLLSEVLLDRERRYALVSSSFRCGVLCGSGNTDVYKKTGEEWKIYRVCSSVIY